MKRDEIPGPSQAVLDVFAVYAWPGNVRQLEQVLRRMVIDTGALTDADVAAQTLRSIAPSVDAAEVPSPAVPQELGSLDDAEKRHIEAVLRATAGNQTQAAFILGIERKTLARKIKRLGISMDPS
jgi:DNA-binding NtrC family response regulator